MNEGWKCPVCGRGIAPSEKTCSHGGSGINVSLPYVFESVQPRFMPDWKPFPGIAFDVLGDAGSGP